MTRLGIMDYKIYIKKQFPNEKLQYLDSCVVSQNILDQMEANIEECISSKSYVDLKSTLPSVFSEEDVEIILNTILTSSKRLQTIIIDNYVISKTFIEKLSENCTDLLNQKVKEVVESGQYQQYLISSQTVSPRGQKNVEIEEKVDKREERRKKAASGKSGGGTQGRETKTKATKKNFRTANKTEVEDDDIPVTKTLEIITVEDIKGNNREV